MLRLYVATVIVSLVATELTVTVESSVGLSQLVILSLTHRGMNTATYLIIQVCVGLNQDR